MAVQKSVVWRTSDGQVHSSKALAELHEDKTLVIHSITKAIPSLDRKVADGIISALLNNGWRPPKKTRAARVKKIDDLKLGATK